MKFDRSINEFIRASTSAQSVGDAIEVQTLWSGYGRICRVELVGGPVSSVIVKHVTPPTDSNHPRGWDGEQSHQRKLQSYAVESNWYQDFSTRCDESCRVPRCWATRHQDGEFLFVLEDLNASGFPRRRSSLDRDGVMLGLDWLANFHAHFLGVPPDGLWKVGTYWHLATRPEEFLAMEPGVLKDAAEAIDARLSGCRFRTLIHGDAKVANFCFSIDGSRIAAVDFQYVGGGCGMKDVAYFLGSCLDESECERDEARYLDHYFVRFRQAVASRHRNLDVASIELEWRTLYPFAWADFTRFMLGWCPGHSKLNRYSRRIAEQIAEQLKSH